MEENPSQSADSLPTLSRADVRELDRIAIEEFGIPGVVLMENAGRAIVHALLEERPDLRRVLILCGAGNNGGDGYVVARYLADRGLDITVIESGGGRLAPDASVFRAVCVALAIPMVDLADHEALSAALTDRGSYDVVIDALLGTGFQGALRPDAVEWLTDLNSLTESWRAFRVAIDVPSGLDVDTGAVARGCFQADLTLTLSANKLAFGEEGAMLPAVQAVAGKVRVLSIDIPRAVYRALGSAY